MNSARYFFFYSTDMFLNYTRTKTTLMSSLPINGINEVWGVEVRVESYLGPGSGVYVNVSPVA